MPGRPAPHPSYNVALPILSNAFFLNYAQLMSLNLNFFTWTRAQKTDVIYGKDAVERKIKFITAEKCNNNSIKNNLIILSLKHMIKYYL